MVDTHIAYWITGNGTDGYTIFRNCLCTDTIGRANSLQGIAQLLHDKEYPNPDSLVEVLGETTTTSLFFHLQHVTLLEKE